MVLCDLQGGVEDDAIVLTDPVLNSRRRQFGPTDLGQKGIETFFHSHICSSWCESTWKKPSSTAKHFNPTQGTSMMLA